MVFFYVETYFLKDKTNLDVHTSSASFTVNGTVVRFNFVPLVLSDLGLSFVQVIISRSISLFGHSVCFTIVIVVYALCSILNIT